MTQEELWNRFLKKNPSLEADNPTFTKEGLKKFFHSTFQAGYDHGYAKGMDLRDMKEAAKPYHDPLEIFRSVFGKEGNP
jgi:hypothetical protein